jgi:hypothetical protein
MYKRQYWQDHVTQYENRYREQNNADGTITHIPVEGEVLQEGTPQNANNFNNLETGVFAAYELGAEAVRLLLQHGRTLSGLEGESGAVTLTNSLSYPFNNSAKTVTIAAVRDTEDYSVDVYTGADNPSIGRVVVYDKLKNGFKIAHTGSAASVAVKYTVRGGLL